MYYILLFVSIYIVYSQQINICGYTHESIYIIRICMRYRFDVSPCVYVCYTHRVHISFASVSQKKERDSPHVVCSCLGRIALVETLASRSNQFLYFASCRRCRCRFCHLRLIAILCAWIHIYIYNETLFSASPKKARRTPTPLCTTIILDFIM
jgi:hypothetical protein